MIKKIRWLSACAILIFVLIYLREIFFMNHGYANNFAVAVVQISSAKLKSYVTYYDEDLNEISTQQINHGGLGHFWDFPKLSNDKIFMNVKGTDLWLKKQVIALDLNTGKYNLYNVGQKFNNCLAVDNRTENLYVTNCDGKSNIVKYNISAKLTKKLCIPDFYVTHMDIIDEKKLLTFGNTIGQDNFSSLMYLIDTGKMKIEKAIDITKYGFGQYDFKKIGDNVFFASNTKDLIENDSGKGSTILYKYNLETNKITKIELGIDHPKQILFHNDKLIISHEDWHQNGNYVSVYDLKLHKVSSLS